MKLILALLAVVAAAAGAVVFLMSSAKASAKGIFSDDFSKPSQLWYPGTYSFGIVDYRNGTLHFNVLPNQDVFDVYNKVLIERPAQMTVTVDAQRLAGNEINNMGVICAAGASDRYQLLIGSTGIYGISRVVNGRIKILRVGNDAKAISPDGVNHIVANCQGSRAGRPVFLSLSVNGKLLAHVIDRHGIGYPTNAGVFTASRSAGGPVEVSYDKFVVDAKR